MIVQRQDNQQESMQVKEKKNRNGEILTQWLLCIKC